MLLHREKGGDASNRDVQLRRPPPRISCEPITPTPSVMRAHRTWWTRRWRNRLRHFGKRKHLDILPAPMSYSSTAKRSACDIYPPDGSEKMRISLYRRRTGQETTDCTDPTSPIAFRTSSQALSPKFTVRTIRLGGDIDGPLRKGIFLTHFAQPEACSCGAKEHPIFLQGKGLSSEASRCSSERCSPLPGAILLR